MLKKLLLIIIIMPMASSPMFTSFQHMRPLVASAVRSHQLSQRAHASSKAMSALEQQVATCKKLHHELTKKEKQLAETLKIEDAFKSIKLFMGVCSVSRMIGDVLVGDVFDVLMDVSMWAGLIGVLHCTQPPLEHIVILEKDRKRLISEISYKKSHVLEPLIQAIEQEACEGKGNAELYDSMQMLRTAMEVRSSASNLTTKEKHD